MDCRRVTLKNGAVDSPLDHCGLGCGEFLQLSCQAFWPGSRKWFVVSCGWKVFGTVFSCKIYILNIKRLKHFLQTYSKKINGPVLNWGTWKIKAYDFQKVLQNSKRFRNTPEGHNLKGLVYIMCKEPIISCMHEFSTVISCSKNERSPMDA